MSPSVQLMAKEASMSNTDGRATSNVSGARAKDQILACSNDKHGAVIDEAECECESVSESLDLGGDTSLQTRRAMSLSPRDPTERRKNKFGDAAYPKE